MDIVSEILRYIIIFGGFILGIVNIVDAIKSSYKRRISDAPWSKWAYALLGFYWCATYSILMLIPIEEKYEFTSSWIRPSISFLVMLLLLGKQKPVYLPDIIKNNIKKIKERREKTMHGQH
jgi:hypothetical protein